MKGKLTSLHGGFAIALLCVVLLPGILNGQKAEDGIAAGVLTLEQSLVLADMKNPLLLSAREKVRATGGSVVEARSGLYPHLQASAGAFHLESLPVFTFGPAESRLGRENMFFVSLGATQTLYAGGRIRGGIEVANLSLAIARERLQRLRDEVAFEVKKSFYGILFARELVKVRRDALSLLQEHSTATQKKYREGTVAEFDTVRAEVEAVNAVPPLIEAENQLLLAEAGFKRAVGLDLQSPVSVAGDLKERPVFLSESEAQTRALGCRAEVETATLAVQIAGSEEKVAHAGDKPTVSLFADYFGTSPEFFIARSGGLRWSWVTGINFSLPVFSGFETRGRVATKRAEHDEAKARLRDVKEQVLLEVRQAVLRLDEARASVSSLGQNVLQAERALRIARIRYEQGVGTQLEVTDSQVALTRARVNQLSAFYRYELAFAELERALGCPLSFGEWSLKRE